MHFVHYAMALAHPPLEYQNAEGQVKSALNLAKLCTHLVRFGS